MKIINKEEIANLSKKQRIILAATIFLIVFLIILVIVFFLTNREKGKRDEVSLRQPIPSITKEEEEREGEIVDQSEIKATLAPKGKTHLSSKDIIKEILEFIDSQRNPDGFYNYVAHYEDQCRKEEGEQVCPFGGFRFFRTTNAWTALAYINAYQIFQDESYLSQAKKDLEKLLFFCQQEPSECLKDFTPLLKLYKITSDEKLLNFLKTSGELLLTTSANQSMPSIEARKLAFLYDLTQDTRFLDEAKKRLELSKISLEDMRSIQEADQKNVIIGYNQYQCQHSLSALSFYETTGEEKYLEEAELFLQEIILKEDNPRFNSVYAILSCVEALQGFHRVTSRARHYTSASKLLLFLLQNYWDSSYNKKFYGEGMILELKNSAMNSLSGSTWVINLLSKRPFSNWPL